MTGRIGSLLLTAVLVAGCERADTASEQVLIERVPHGGIR